MTATKAAGPLAVLESGFRINPGKETDFLAYQATVVPLAMEQDGFRSVYSGPVWDSTWVYFGARFDSEEQMNAWHGEPQHRVIQKSAPNWWTALYLRKWRPPMPDEVLGDRLMSETSILVDAALDDTQTKLVRQTLARLGAAGAQPFETLTGEFETQPFQFAGPVQIAPAAESVLYSLITHWSSADHFDAWKSSGFYRALQSLAMCRASSSCRWLRRGIASTCGTTSCSGTGNGRLMIVARGWLALGLGGLGGAWRTATGFGAPEFVTVGEK